MRKALKSSTLWDNIFSNSLISMMFVVGIFVDHIQNCWSVTPRSFGVEWFKTCDNVEIFLLNSLSFLGGCKIFTWYQVIDYVWLNLIVHLLYLHVFGLFMEEKVWPNGNVKNLNINNKIAHLLKSLNIPKKKLHVRVSVKVFV